MKNMYSNQKKKLEFDENLADKSINYKKSTFHLLYIIKKLK